MAKKLKLADLAVDSFITGEKVRGGNYATCECSLPTGRICEYVCTRPTRPVGVCN